MGGIGVPPCSQVGRFIPRRISAYRRMDEEAWTWDV